MIVPLSDDANDRYSTSHIPAATPFAEGVYEITSTGQESHLAYKTTYPEIGEVQNELGVHEKGGYIVSVKNPEFPGPGNATIGHPPAYPESIQKKFRGLRWMPLVPELLDYDNTQLLVIGEELDVVGKSAEEVSEDQRSGKGEALWSELDKHAHDVSWKYVLELNEIITRRRSATTLSIAIVYLLTSRRVLRSILKCKRLGNAGCDRYMGPQILTLPEA